MEWKLISFKARIQRLEYKADPDIALKYAEFEFEFDLIQIIFREIDMYHEFFSVQRM